MGPRAVPSADRIGRVTDIPTTERWVATRHSAREAASAFLMLTLRRRRLWLLISSIGIVFAVLVALSIDDGYSPVTRIVWGSLYAVVPTVVIAAVILGIGHLVNRRIFGRRLREGVVLESGFANAPWCCADPGLKARCRSTESRQCGSAATGSSCNKSAFLFWAPGPWNCSHLATWPGCSTAFRGAASLRISDALPGARTAARPQIASVGASWVATGGIREGLLGHRGKVSRRG
jgi:hypothetical protein